MGQEKDTSSKGNQTKLITKFCYQTKNKYKKNQRHLFRNKVICKVGKGQMKKIQFQSIYIQIHMSAQLLSSSLSNADYLVQDAAPRGPATVRWLTYTLLFSFLIIPPALLTIHAWFLCILPALRQDNFQSSYGFSHWNFPVQLIHSPVTPSLVCRHLLLSKSHLFSKPGHVFSREAGRLRGLNMLPCDDRLNMQSGLDNSTNLRELLRGLAN